MKEEESARKVRIALRGAARENAARCARMRREGRGRGGDDRVEVKASAAGAFISSLDQLKNSLEDKRRI